MLSKICNVLSHSVNISLKFLEKKEQETSAKLKIPTIPLKLLSPKLKSPSLKLLDEVKFEKNSSELNF